MAIPDYQSFMLPLLRVTGDRKDHTSAEVVDVLAAQFGVEDGERREMLPSGQLKLNNRVSWARTYLAKAGLLEAVGRGRFRISQRGLDVLGTGPSSVNTRFLEQFPEFQRFQKGSRPDATSGADGEPAQTPEEAIAASYQRLRAVLGQELLERIKASPPKFFERLVVHLLVSMGYGGSRQDAGQAVGQSGDGGIDGIIKEDKLGLDVLYIQAKRWDGTVGRPVVQAFAGSLEGRRARRGVLITTSQFSADALDYVERIEKRIVLISGEQLAQLMIDNGVGVKEESKFVIKNIDLDYFEE